VPLIVRPSVSPRRALKASSSTAKLPQTGHKSTLA
jgi:hypothetical protein